MKQAQALLQGFWSPERLQTMLDALLFHYMPMTVRPPAMCTQRASPPMQRKELSEWAHSPEDLYHELESAPEDADRLRPAAERLWLHAARHHTQAVVACLGRRLPEVLAGAPLGAPHATGPGDANVVRKAAAYSAVGLAAGDLHDHLHGFRELLHGTLMSDMECTAPATRPVQRQAMKLVAQWCSKLEPGDRPPLYALLVTAMHGDDVVVALTAARSLHTLVDDWCAACSACVCALHSPCAGVLRSST